MFELFYAGGAFYMGVLTLVFIAMIAVAVINGLAVFKEENEQIEVLVRRLSYIKSVGLFALIVGILFQLMGLVGAFQNRLLNSEGLVGTEFSSMAITDGIGECDVSLEIARCGELPRPIVEIFEPAFGRLEISDC